MLKNLEGQKIRDGLHINSKPVPEQLKKR